MATCCDTLHDLLPMMPPQMSAKDTQNTDSDAQTIPDDSWDRYWRYGFLTSCADAFDSNYQGELRRTWEIFFSGLPQRARILDIGTGNGAIAAIANEVSATNQRGFEIHGIDRAEIDPQATLKSDASVLDGIHFHSRTAAEDTGFDSASIDAVTGQFAFEYTDVDKTIDELARILKPGAQAMFIMHHGDSIVLSTTREELRLAALLFSGEDIFDAALALLEKLGSVPATERAGLASDSQAEALRHNLNQAAAVLTTALKSSPHPEILKTAMTYVSRAFTDLDKDGLEKALDQLREHKRELQANVGRLQDLQRASVSEQKSREIAQKMRESGFEADFPEALFHAENQLLGWQLRAKKSP